MPLLAALIGNIAGGLVAIFGRFVAFDLALKFAAYTTWILVFGAFLTSVFVCVSSLHGMLVAMWGATGGVNGGMLSAFIMGLGMLIPANAGAVIACVSSVWIATSIYKIQKQGIFNFSK